MRTLERNKQNLWLVECLGQKDKLDSEGFKTGEVINIYGQPKKIRMALRTTNGKIIQQMFGDNANYDSIGDTTDLDIKNNSLLFLSEPTLPYDKTYDFQVASVRKSINSWIYGLRSRT